MIGRDARALGVDVVLEPFVNIDRDPVWSRAFNTFGEDPLLTGQTGAGEITGIQGQGTMAMVKHFISYDGGNNVVVDEQTLHEIYLEPFADAINAGVASVMCSYNTLNVVAATPSAGGTPAPYACGNSQDPDRDPARGTGLPGLTAPPTGARTTPPASSTTAWIWRCPAPGSAACCRTYFSAGRPQGGDRGGHGQHVHDQRRGRPHPL